MSTSLTELEKAIASLDEALELHQKTSDSDISVKRAFRDACIQRFEYCLEFSWKISMKTLGSSTLATKPAIREMARNNLITNPDLWMTFVEARNQTSHSYDEDVANLVFKSIEKFQPEVKTLLISLKAVK